MKNKQKSLARRIKRGHAVIEKSEFVKTNKGEPKLILREKTKRGKWVNHELN